MVRYRTLDEVIIEQLQKDPEFAQLYLKGSLKEYEKDKDAYYFLGLYQITSLEAV